MINWDDRFDSEPFGDGKVIRRPKRLPDEINRLKMDDSLHPWDMQEGEPLRWYERFLVYRDMGAARSLAGAYKLVCQLETPDKQPGRAAPNSWRKAAKHYRWDDRVEEYDLEMMRATMRGVHLQQAMADKLASKAVSKLDGLMDGENPVDVRLAAVAVLGWIGQLYRMIEPVKERVKPWGGVSIIDFTGEYIKPDEDKK